MAMIEINHHPSDGHLRQFAGIWMPLACAFIALAVWRRTGSLDVVAAILALAAAGAIVGLMAPQRMRPVWIGWMYAVYPVGWTVSHLILGVLYYLILTPLGLAMRLSGRDPLQRRFDRGAGTYWVPRRPRGGAGSYVRQF